MGHPSIHGSDGCWWRHFHDRSIRRWLLLGLPCLRQSPGGQQTQRRRAVHLGVCCVRVVHCPEGHGACSWRGEAWHQIICYLKEDQSEFLEERRLKDLVKKHS